MRNNANTTSRREFLRVQADLIHADRARFSTRSDTDPIGLTGLVEDGYHQRLLHQVLDLDVVDVLWFLQR